MMTTLPQIRVLAAVATAVVTIACAATTAGITPGEGPIAVGTWGGDSGALIVGDTAMHLHIACTYGDIHGPVTPDANGRFSVTGQYLLRAYPIAVGPMMPAQFDGQRDGNTVTIRVTVNDTTQGKTVVRGPVTVELGATPKMMPCPICRDPYGMLRRNQSVALLRRLR